MKAIGAIPAPLLFGVLCALFGAASGVNKAAAAVRLCKAHVTSKVFSADSERDARREAIKDWTQKAKSAGLAHPSWRIARYKILKCVSRSGQFECVAHASPCTIKQKAPPRGEHKKQPKTTAMGASKHEAKRLMRIVSGSM